MENSVILNIIFLVILCLGSVSYLVWLGSNVIKLKGDLEANTNEVDLRINDLYDHIDKQIDSVIKTIDKLDSRVDTRFNQSEDRYETDSQRMYEDLEGRNSEMDNSFRSAISDLVEDVDKLKK
jgi:hypothetical protein